jgi:hypothetical protein
MFSGYPVHMDMWVYLDTLVGAHFLHLLHKLGVQIIGQESLVPTQVSFQQTLQILDLMASAFYGDLAKDLLKHIPQPIGT